MGTLTVKEALALLIRIDELGHGNKQLVVQFESNRVRVGARALTGVVAFDCGIDWEKNYIIARTAKKLGVDSDTLNQQKLQMDKLMAFVWHVERLLDSNKISYANKLESIACAIRQLSLAACEGETST